MTPPWERIDALIAQRCYTFTAIAAQCGCCVATVCNRAAELGVRPVSTRGRRGHPHALAIDELLRGRMLTQKQIAAACRASLGCVASRAAALGIGRLPHARLGDAPQLPRGRPPAVQPGQVYGSLTVTGAAGRSAGGVIMWRCSCSCGGERTARTDLLRSGRATRCSNCPRKSRDKFIVAAASTKPHAVAGSRGKYERIKPALRKQIEQWLREGVWGTEITRRTGVSATTISKIKGALK